MPTPATFYKFRKETNSTAIPDNVEGIVKIEYQIELKSPTNICAPVIMLNTGAAANSPIEYNYVHIPAFNRYYWVNDWVYNNGLWAASLSVDVLASFRGQIGATTQYVTRSGADFDPAIIDTFYPTKSGLTLSNVDIQWSWTSYANGCFVVGIVNDDSAAMGGTVSYYIMDKGALANFATFLMQDPRQWLDITDISENLAKALIDPTQYIVSVRWIPYAVGEITGKTQVSTLKFGFYSVGVTGGVWMLTSTAIVKEIKNIAIPKHPQIDRGNYLNDSPYTAYVLHFPPFGDMPLDCSMLQNATKMHMRVVMDFATTAAVLTVYSDAGPLQSSEVMKARTTIGVDIRMDKVAADFANIGGGFYMIGTLASTALKGIAGALEPGAAYIGSQVREEDYEYAYATPTWTMYDETTNPFTGEVTRKPTEIRNINRERLENANKKLSDFPITNLSNTVSNIVSSYGASLLNVHSAGAVGSFAEYFYPSVYMQCAFALIADENAITGARNIQYRGRPLCKMRQIAAIPGYMEIMNPYLEILGATIPEITAIKSAMTAGMWYA